MALQSLYKNVLQAVDVYKLILCICKYNIYLTHTVILSTYNITQYANSVKNRNYEAR